MEIVVAARSLTKRYGNKTILDGLTLELAGGGIHAVMGANGAGKSTFLKILLGFIAPTRGCASVLGVHCDRLGPRLRSRIAFANDDHALPPRAPVRSLIAMHRRQYPAWDERSFHLAARRFNINPELRVGELSRGDRAGLNLALCLAQSPDLLLLDEPTLGLDVPARRAFLDALLQTRPELSPTVIYCSNQVDEVERLADNLVVLVRGKPQLVSSPDSFSARISHWISDIPFAGPPADEVPGLLQASRIDGLHHHYVLDQGDEFAAFLHAHGARSARRATVSLEAALGALLSASRLGSTAE